MIIYLPGQYHSLTKMTFEEQQQIVKDFMLFDETTSTLISSSRMSRDWPDARGIWKNDDENVVIWVNEEDHSRIVVMEKGANMKRVFTRFCNYLNLFEQALNSNGHSFMWNQHFGYLVTCPKNLGTCLRASVLIKLPLLSKRNGFEGLLENLRLQKTSNNGEDTSSTDGLCDISNEDRLGHSEVRNSCHKSSLSYTNLCPFLKK